MSRSAGPAPEVGGPGRSKPRRAGSAALSATGLASIEGVVTLRRLLSLMTLLALMVAPVGRAGAAEAASPAHDMMAMPQHCSDMPKPAENEPAGAAIDCMTACAVVSPAAPSTLPIIPADEASPDAPPPSADVGITTGSDPPPPRLS